jgi:peptidoglycan hydrolase CwlO-like protein
MNGYGKQILVGVAVLVLAAVIIGSGGTTISNTLAQAATEVTVDQLKEDVAENSAITSGIDVMAEQISDIKDDVKKVLDKMDK